MGALSFKKKTIHGLDYLRVHFFYFSLSASPVNLTHHWHWISKVRFCLRTLPHVSEALIFHDHIHIVHVAQQEQTELHMHVMEIPWWLSCCCEAFELLSIGLNCLYVNSCFSLSLSCLPISLVPTSRPPGHLLELTLSFFFQTCNWE